MTRLLALCTGATVGLAVGWLWGSNASRLVEAHALAGGAVRVPEQRSGPSVSSEPPEPGNGAQGGIDLDEWMAQRGLDPDRRCRDVDPYSLNVCSRTPGHGGAHRDGLTAWGTAEPSVMDWKVEIPKPAAPEQTRPPPGERWVQGLATGRQGRRRREDRVAVKDHLKVTGSGTNRTAALEDADAQARAYYGEGIAWAGRYVGGAHVSEVIGNLGGPPARYLFEVEVVYFLDPS